MGDEQGTMEAADMTVDDAERASVAERDALAAAIEENPEAVAAFVERLGLVNELLDAADLATAAMDDEMVARLTGTSSLLLESADGLATRETSQLAASVGENAADLDSALATLLRLERSGALDDLADLADVASLATAAIDDEMVAKLAGTGESLGSVADEASDPATARTLRRLLRAAGEAGEEEPEPIGAVGLLRATRDPEVKRGLGFLLALARAVGRDVERSETTR